MRSAITDYRFYQLLLLIIISFYFDGLIINSIYTSKFTHLKLKRLRKKNVGSAKIKLFKSTNTLSNSIFNFYIWKKKKPNNFNFV